jgi:hypothetical protein
MVRKENKSRKLYILLHLCRFSMYTICKIKGIIRFCTDCLVIFVTLYYVLFLKRMVFGILFFFLFFFRDFCMLCNIYHILWKKYIDNVQIDSNNIHNYFESI